MDADAGGEHRIAVRKERRRDCPYLMYKRTFEMITSTSDEAFSKVMTEVRYVNTDVGRSFPKVKLLCNIINGFVFVSCSYTQNAGSICLVLCQLVLTDTNIP